MKFNVNVVINGNAKEEYERLRNAVKEEISKGLAGTTNQTLFNSINQKIEFLKNDPQYGTHVSRNKIPKEYVILYNVENIWKINLSGAWRMIYTVRGNEIEILALILDILDHKDYEKKFGYH